MSAKLFDFCVYGMSENAITYIPRPQPGTKAKPFTANLDDEDIQSLDTELDIDYKYVTFGALSSLIARGMVKGTMAFRK
jgi:hypothetical protein